MIITVKLKLLPSPEQAQMLLATMREANACCDHLSTVAWESKAFKQFNLHRIAYRDTVTKFRLGSQMVVRCIAKTADAYKTRKGKRRTFRPLGSIAYDARLKSYKGSTVSLWVCKGDKGGRIKIPFVCHQSGYIPYFGGEADLMYRKGKFYLLQTADVPESPMTEVTDFIGCDFGLKDIVYMSDGTHVSSSEIKRVKTKYAKVRKRVQNKGTRGCKRLLKRLQGREARFVSITNHTISKGIVAKAKSSGKGIAIENLEHIRNGARRKGGKSKTVRSMVNGWSFFQLRSYLTYKARLAGVPLVVVNPAYTSQTCSCCGKLGVRKGKHFRCPNCGNAMDADFNAARNIAARGGVVNHLGGNVSASPKAAKSSA